MSSPDRSKALSNLLSRLRAERPAVSAQPDDCARGAVVALTADPVLREFIRSFLMWESTTQKADAALANIEAAFVDFNEFRVSLVGEMAAALGSAYPKAEERMRMLKAALNEIFRREHALRLAHLADKPKREARAYLDGLPSTPAYVAARALAVCLGGHALPVDERLRLRLTAVGVLDEGLTLDEATAQIERACRAGEAVEAHALLQAWSDEGASVVVPKGRGAKASGKVARPKSGRNGSVGGGAEARVAVSAKKRTTARPKRKGA